MRALPTSASAALTKVSAVAVSKAVTTGPSGSARRPSRRATTIVMDVAAAGDVAVVVPAAAAAAVAVATCRITCETKGGKTSKPRTIRTQRSAPACWIYSRRDMASYAPMVIFLETATFTCRSPRCVASTFAKAMR
jgi:hypothetical protein